MAAPRAQRRMLRVALSDAAYGRLRALHLRYRLASQDIVLALLETLDAYADPRALDRTLRSRDRTPRQR